jgi:branched-chain amino acid transport system permease protein
VSVRSLAQDLVDAISLGSLYALFALGLSLIFGVMRLANFAHSGVILVGAYTIVVLDAVPWPGRVLAAVAAPLIAAIVLERVAFRPVRSADPSTLLITSFAVAYLLQNLAIIVFGARPRTVDLFVDLNRAVHVGPVSVSTLSLLTIAVTTGLLVALVAFLGRTRLGVQMRAAAEDFGMARLLGVRADNVIAGAFAISGILGGAAAVLLVAQTGAIDPLLGLSPTVIGFIAVVIGGMGSLSGSILGAYLLGAATVMLQALLPEELRPFRDAFVFAAVIAVLVFRPQGLVVPASAVSRV